MYLHQVTVRNFSIHRETSIVLSPITVLVGPNGAGKSAFFDALLNFSMLARGKLSEAFGGYPYSFSATRHRAANPISRIGYDVVMSSAANSPDKLRYRVDYSQVDKGNEATAARFEIHKELLQINDLSVFDRDDPDGGPLKEAAKYLAGDVGILGAVRRAELEGRGAGFPRLVVDSAKEVSRFNKFRLEPYHLRLPSTLPDLTAPEPPRVAYSGENVAGTLYYLKETSSPALARIVEGLHRALPDFEDFDFNTVGAQRIGFSVRPERYSRQSGTILTGNRSTCASD